MVPDLSDRDRAKFEALREQLTGVSRSQPPSKSLESSPGPLDPMLASTLDGELADVSENEWIAERKYDGTRIILQKFDGEVSLYTRRHVERSETLTELTACASSNLPDGLVLDGEYTFLDPEGVSHFIPIHTASDKIDEKDLEPRYVVFDVIAQDHTWCTRDPLMERKDRVDESISDGELLYRGERETTGLQSYFDTVVENGGEGVIIKRKRSGYHLGTRSDHWQKVKAFTETDVLAVGYTPGEGDRVDTFGALVMSDGERYVGRVGSGFSDAELDTLIEEMEPIEERPFPEDQVGMEYTPIEPFVIQVKYQEVTDSTHLRAPVFLRQRPDKPLEDVQPVKAPNH